MKKKQKYDPLEDPRLSDKEIEKIEDDAQLISEREFSRLVKHSKKGSVKAKRHTPSKKAA